MNFLNKKHVQSFANTGNAKGYNAQEESSFSPYTGSYISNKTQLNKGIQLKQSPTGAAYQQSSSRIVERQASQYASGYTDKNNSKTSLPGPNISSLNICQQHQNQLLRHLCLQCNQLLCSQCISDHLQDHRQRTQTIPKIQTINKLKKDMNIKAQKILQFMQDNNPKIVLSDISQLKYQAITKIHDMKEEVIKAFQEWCKIQQKHVINDIIEEKELADLANDMGKLREEVLGLYNQMIGPQHVNAEIIKRVHQIQSEKLQAAYLEMFNKFSKTVLKSKFTLDIDFNYLMETFEKCIALRPMHVGVSERDQDNNQNEIKVQEKRKSEKSLPQSGSRKQLGIRQSSQQQKEKQFMQIQSIESLVEPATSLRAQQNADIPLINKSKQVLQQQGDSNNNRQRRLSRKESGKRLGIFATSEDENRGNNDGQQNQ